MGGNIVTREHYDGNDPTFPVILSLILGGSVLQYKGEE